RCEVQHIDCGPALGVRLTVQSRDGWQGLSRVQPDLDIAPAVCAQLRQRRQPEVDTVRGSGLIFDDVAILRLVEIAAQIQRRIGQLERTVAAWTVTETDAGQIQGWQGETGHKGSDNGWGSKNARGGATHS